MMDNRERFHAVMAFEPMDGLCHIEQGFLDGVYERWKSEGLPSHVKKPVFDYVDLDGGTDLFGYYNILRPAYILCAEYFVPPFEELVLEETERHKVVRDRFGRTIRHHKASSCVPQYLDFPVKCRADYEALKERLQPALETRYPAHWDQLAAVMRNQDQVLVCTHMDGFYGCPRFIMGDENLLMNYCLDPELVREIINDRCEFYMRVYEKAIREAKPDMAFIWEDMCYRNGPLISPEMVREFMLPAYKKLTDWLKGLGVKNIIVDSDGDIRLLIPLWIEGGVTGLLPFEVKAGMDVVTIGKDFPKLQIIGGINKHLFEDGHSLEEMKEELERVLPAMMKRGGYCVSMDHWVNPQIPLKHFEYYVQWIRQQVD